MKILGVIPARYASTRLPGKPMVMLGNKSMIQRVYEQVSKAKCLHQVAVATDDKRIFEHVKAFGGHAVLTSEKHNSGTERCCEVLEIAESENNYFDLVVNIQGDEPFICPTQIEAVIACFNKPHTQIATLGKYIHNEEDLNNFNVVKLVKDINNKALYFSRYPIPFQRGMQGFKEELYIKHIGIYAYRSSVLKEITKLPTSILETSESLEQLRWIENAYQIHVNLTNEESISIDTPEDLKRALDMLK